MREEGNQPHLPEEREYRKLFGLDIYLTPVFVISSIAILIFVVGALVFQEGATKVFGNTRTWLTTNLDWLFMITANLVFLFCLVVAISPLGKVRLGGVDAKPEYSNLNWLSMLFAAGGGHRSAVFRGGGADVLPAKPSARHYRRDGGSRDRRHIGDRLSLGVSRLGNLWRRRTRPRLLCLQSRPSPHHPLGVLSPARRPHLGLARARY